MLVVSKQRDDVKERVCTGKVPLNSVAKARKILKAIHSKHGYCNSQAYKCKFCGKWHLGRKLIKHQVNTQ